ncbi:CSLREA domain-containing protein [Acinetobacter calcoaceticus]|uniref:CSLREA domain-containing protein n=1 Tax=Acinetobacter calcoaceticus TaxID=471 RepID=UPI00190005BE|nr:CSLREA domain-containing protein [Acinetobacter calcoaceticus]MBJ9720850.1 CSLREA domain-containing protein [Acinetobacter calcoaceticus]
MKNYKKAFLALAVIAAMPLFADTTNGRIDVTTFADEDGDNTDACSLREAIKTAELRKSYGGCTVIDTRETTQKSIQLKAGTYTLTKELVPNANIAIFGADPVDWQKKSVLTNDYPAQLELQTHINAQGKSRIFNTTTYKQPLSLNNVILENGVTTGQGGAIYAGADIALQNSQILSSQAVSGGAIYLGSPNITLSLNHSLLQYNNATQGSVLSMGCFSDTVYAPRTITIGSTSVISNGDTNSTSTFEFCGKPQAALTNNTIAKNIANSGSGSIIKFTGDTNNTANTSSILSSSSSLVLLNNTIVENNANSTFLYDKLGTKKLNFNLLAYNNGNYACKYLLGAAAEEKNVGLILDFNALDWSSATGKCDIPKESLPTSHTNIDISTQSFSNLLGPLETATAYTGFLPIYYPKDISSDNDLIDVDKDGKGSCATTDQRGLNRLADGASYYQSVSRNSCDIGAVELMKLTSGDLKDVSNISLTTLISTYQQNYDLFDKYIKDPKTPTNFITYYKVRLAEFKNLLDNFTNNTDNTKYRAIYIDLKNYNLPLPNEDANHVLKFFNTTDYNIATEALGIGSLDDTYNKQQVDGLTDKENLFCEWKPAIQQIVFYRKDDVITQAGSYAYCKYTITTADNKSSSSGLIKARFNNIEPVSGDGTVTFKYLANEIIPLDLLKYANDDGDGPVSTLSKPKSQFWVDEKGVELPIYLPSKTSKDGIFKVVKADREGPCPKDDKDKTCYGGNIYIQANNVFNVFNDSLSYNVYDADGKISSKAGTINLVSTATTTDDSRSGGGSLGILSIASLLGLIAYRRYRK